jgi:hypothetical protein
MATDADTLIGIMDYIVSETDLTAAEYSDLLSTLPANPTEEDFQACLIDIMNAIVESRQTEIDPMLATSYMTETMDSIQIPLPEPIIDRSDLMVMDFPDIPASLTTLMETADVITYCPDATVSMPLTMTTLSITPTFDIDSSAYLRTGVFDLPLSDNPPMQTLSTPIPDSNYPQIVYGPNTIIDETTVFTADYIHILEGPVYVQNDATLIIQQGTVLCYNTEAMLVIRDGANLITGRYGAEAPADPNKTPTDLPANPVVMTPLNWISGMLDYTAAVVIEEDAGDYCSLTNMYIKGATIGILSKREATIFNNYFYACSRPIISMGHRTHEIINNQIWYTGWYDNATKKHWAAIEIYTDPADANTVTEPCTVLVAHNTTFDSGHGLIVHGHQCARDTLWLDNPADPNNPVLNPDYHDPNEVAPEVYCLNNTFTYNYGGDWPALYLVDGVMKPVVVHTGLFGLDFLSNMPIEAIGTVQEHNVFPFHSLYDYEVYPIFEMKGGYRCLIEYPELYYNGTCDPRLMFLAQGSIFRNTGFGEIYDVPELLGWTATNDFMPVGSSGLHLGRYYPHSMQNVNQGFAPTDVDQDSFTRLSDFSLFAQGYGLSTDPNINPAVDPNLLYYRCDFDDSGVIDINDLAYMTDDWMSYGSWSADPNYVPEHPAYTVQIDQDPDFVHGNVLLTVDGYMEKIRALWLRVGSDLVNIFASDDETNRYELSLDTTSFGNGLHQCQLVSFDDPNTVTVGEPFYLNFANAYHDLLTDDDQGIITGFSEIDAEIVYTAVIEDVNDVTIPLAPGGFTLRIPTDMYDGLQDIVEVQFLEVYPVDPNDPNGLPLVFMALADEMPEVGSEDWYTFLNKPVVVPSDPNTIPIESDWHKYDLVVIMPYENLTPWRVPAIKKMAEVFTSKNFEILYLYRYNATPENVKNALTVLPHTRFVYFITHCNSGLKDWHPNSSPFFKLHSGGKGIFGDKFVDVWGGPPAKRNGINMRDWGLMDSGKICIVFFDGCESAKNSMLAESFGIFSGVHPYQFFIGWDRKVFAHKYYRDAGYTAVVTGFWNEFRLESLWRARYNITQFPHCWQNFLPTDTRLIDYVSDIEDPWKPFIILTKDNSDIYAKQMKLLYDAAD